MISSEIKIDALDRSQTLMSFNEIFQEKRQNKSIACVCVHVALFMRDNSASIQYNTIQINQFECLVYYSMSLT